MLTEIPNPRQIADEPQRRWFHSPEMDLIVWFGDHSTPHQPTAFQLCYDKRRGEKALNWKAERGFKHMNVDDGEGDPGKHKGSPLLVPDGAFDSAALQRQFATEGKTLPDTIRLFVTTKLALTQTEPAASC